MANETNNTPIEWIQKLQQYRSKDKQDELAKILAFGEKYNEEGENLKNKFWREYDGNNFRYLRGNFINLITQYKESKQKFINGLCDEEKGIINNLKGISREKFFDEFLHDRILYNGNTDKSYDRNVVDYSDKNLSFMEIEKITKEYEDKLQPGMEINFTDTNLSLISLKIIAEKWEGKLKPWMYINFYKNDMGNAGIKILAKKWRDSLQPGFNLDLGRNQIGDEGIKILSEEWKDKLQIGINLSLCDNSFGLNGFHELIKGWKDRLQPGMTLNFGRNKIGDEGADLIVNEWKDRLQPGMALYLRDTGIGDEGAIAIAQNIVLKDGVELDLTSNIGIHDEGKKALQECVERHRDKGINCRILV